MNSTSKKGQQNRLEQKLKKTRTKMKKKKKTSSMSLTLHRIFLSLGSNLGDRRENLHQALELLQTQRINIKKISSLYETEPVGYLDQPWFYNIVVEAKTKLEPEKLLQTTAAIEQALGRQRTIALGPRTVDIDILFYENLIINTPELTIPHPRLHERNFVLVPLAEIAPNFIHPHFQKPIKMLKNECQDQSQIKKSSK